MFGLSSLKEACNLPGELFISSVASHVLVIQPSLSSLMFQGWMTYQNMVCNKVGEKLTIVSWTSNLNTENTSEKDII